MESVPVFAATVPAPRTALGSIVVQGQHIAAAGRDGDVARGAEVDFADRDGHIDRDQILGGAFR